MLLKNQIKTDSFPVAGTINKVLVILPGFEPAICLTVFSESFLVLVRRYDRFAVVSLFNGILTFVDYLMPKASLEKNIDNF